MLGVGGLKSIIEPDGPENGDAAPATIVISVGNQGDEMLCEGGWTKLITLTTPILRVMRW